MRYSENLSAKSPHHHSAGFIDISHCWITFEDDLISS